MSTYTDLIALAEQIRTAQAESSNTAELVGSTLKAVIEYIRTAVAEADYDNIVATIRQHLQAALDEISSSTSQADTSIADALTEAIEEIEQAKAGIDLDYQTIEGKEVQLTDEQGNPLYPRATGVHKVTEFANKVESLVVPHTYANTSTSGTPTLWSMTSPTYTLVPGKFYLLITEMEIGANYAASAGTVFIQPYKSGSASTLVSKTALASASKTAASCVVGNTYYLYQLFTVSEQQTGYTKIYCTGAGSASKTWHNIFNYIALFECDSEEEARAILAERANIEQNGLVIDEDVIAGINERLDVIDTDMEALQSEVVTKQDVIECWGDSQTEGVSGGTAWPRLLADMAGYSYNSSSMLNPAEHSVNNFANGGEKVCDICARYGSYPVYLNPVTIPAGVTQASCTVFSDGGDNFDSLGIKWGQFNPCYVDGKQIYLRDSSAGGNNKTVGGTASGDPSLEITRPTRIIPYNKALPRNRIMLIQMGANKGYGGTIESFCHMVDGMLEMIPSTEKRYLIISTFTTTWIDDYVAAEKYLAYKYGRHYVNIREYLVNFGLEDNDLEPTEQDTADIAAGKVPHSLCVDFNIHMNTYGTTSQAKCIYQRLMELGYLTEQ